MRSKSEILQEHFNTSSREDAYEIFKKNLYGPPKPLSSWTKLQVPYVAPNHPDLPSIDEITQAMETSRYIHSATCRMGDLVVKKGWDGHLLQEAETLLFLHANSTLRLPALYAVLTAQEQNGPVYYMIMSHVSGFTLTQDKWVSLPATARTQILASLREQVRLLRALPAPGYYGHVHKQGWRPCMGPVQRRADTMCGPFETYAEFATVAYETAEISAAVNGLKPDLNAEMIRNLTALKAFLQSGRGQQPKFTHVDIALKNIIVRPIGGSEDDAQDWEATLVDWADAGWWPAWMQAVTLNLTINMYTRVEGTNFTANKELKMEFINSILEEDGENGYEDVVKLSRSLHACSYYALG